MPQICDMGPTALLPFRRKCMNFVLLVAARLPVSSEDDVRCKTEEFCKKITVDDGLVARSMDLCSEGVCCSLKRCELFANFLGEFT
jgi:hypothetical protein